MSTVPTPATGSLGFQVAAGAVSVDPATGGIAVPLAALEAGIALTVTATDAAGVATGRWRLTLASVAEPLGTAPAVTAAPSLAGSGLVGAALSLDPGAWSGAPAPTLAVAWLRDGAAIAGATGTGYVPTAADDRTLISARVTATNPLGSAVAETAPVAIRRAAPTVAGSLADRMLVHGSGQATVEAAAAFAGEGLAFAVAGAGATIDAATGRVRLPTGTLRTAALVTVTAANSGGSASVGFRVTVAAAPVAPVAVGTLPAVAWPLGAGSRTVSAAAGFSGAGLVYSLATAPAGATIDAVTGLVTVPTSAALAAAPVTVRATNAAGSATQSFTVTVRAEATTFATAAALAEMSFVSEGAAPAFSLDAAGGFARLVPASEGATHGTWSRAAGDGVVRALVRWTAAAAIDRPVGLVARLAKSGSDLRGLRLDAFLASGVTRLDLRQYAGSAASSTAIAASVAVPWANDAWTWLEIEVDGAAVRGRLYPEAAAAPAWQIAGTTTHLTAGGAGFGGFGRFGQRPQIDIRRIEYLPAAGVSPSAASAGEWTLDQRTEQSA